MLVNLKEILAIAEEKKIAIGMFNATGLDSIQAIVTAAEELNMPVIIAHAEVHNKFNDIELIAPVLVSIAKKSKIPICLHLDHGESMEMILRALDLGFTSVMYDGSHLPLIENIKRTKTVVEIARKHNASVEGEIGRLVTKESGQEDNLLVEDPKAYYTKLDEAILFVKETEVDALAIAFGTTHGFYKSTPLLDFDLVKNVSEATNKPLVMHGGSGVPTKDVQRAILNGIRKVNYYSYMSKAGYEAAKEVINSNLTNYLHDVLEKAKEAMRINVKAAIKVFSFID